MIEQVVKHFLGERNNPCSCCPGSGTPPQTLPGVGWGCASGWTLL